MRLRTSFVALCLVLLASIAHAQPNTDQIVADLKAERAKYGATLNDDQCAELVNAVAWKHRAEGWGLSGKAFGTHGTLSDGTQIAHDVLHHQPTNLIYDVLIGAGAHSTPVDRMSPLGPQTDLSRRPWVAPRQPRGTVEPTPLPTTWGPAQTALLQKLQGAGVNDTIRIAEQFAYSFPGAGWGAKRADSTRPISVDVIAQQTGAGLIGYRVVPFGGGTAIPLGGQVFVAVQPRDHVGSTPVVVEPEPQPQPGGDVLARVVAMLERLLANDERVDAYLSGLEPTVARIDENARSAAEAAQQILDARPTTVEWPTYRGDVLGRPFILRPIK